MRYSNREPTHTMGRTCQSYVGFQNPTGRVPQRQSQDNVRGLSVEPMVVRTQLVTRRRRPPRLYPYMARFRRSPQGHLRLANRTQLPPPCKSWTTWSQRATTTLTSTTWNSTSILLLQVSMSAPYKSPAPCLKDGLVYTGRPTTLNRLRKEYKNWTDVTRSVKMKSAVR